MKILSKPEELLLLAICNLKENAYGVEIMKFVSSKTGYEWSIGSIYVPLDRLARMGHVETYQGDPDSKRGGKSKRYYKITDSGIKALVKSKEVQDNLWEGIPNYIKDSI